MMLASLPPLPVLVPYAGLLVLIGALVYLRFSPEAPRGLGWWAFGLGLYVAQVPARLSAPLFGEPLAALLAEALLAMSTIYLLAGAVSFAHRRIHRGAVAAACTLAAGWAALVTGLGWGTMALVAPLALLGGLATSYAGFALLWGRRPALASIQILAAVPFLLWGAQKLAEPLTRPQGWYDTWGAAAQHVTAIALAVGLLLLTHRRLIARAKRELAERFRSEQMLRENERGQALVADISARLVTAPVERIDERIRASLEGLSDFLHYDRAALVLLSEDGTEAQPVDVIFRRSPARDIGTATQTSLPWHFARFKTGQIIHVARVAELPDQAAAERFQLAINGSQEGLWDWDMLADKVWYSTVWRDLIGFSDADMETYLWSDHVHPDDLEPARRKMGAHFRGETEVYRSEYRHRHKDGHWIWIEARGACSRAMPGASRSISPAT